MDRSTPFIPNEKTPDLWHYLREQTAVAEAARPLLLYGMGDGADKVMEVCRRYSIPVSDVFASDGFVRGQSFHGRRVLSFSEARDIYGEAMIVLLCFGTRRPEVLESIQQVAHTCELYVPDVPVSGGELFTSELVATHAAELSAVRETLADEMSRGVLDGIVRARLSGRLDDLAATASPRSEVWSDILHAKDIRTAVDLGAYTGDSLRELMAQAPSLETALCMEPDERSYRKLSAFAAAGAGQGLTLIPLHAAAWDSDTTLVFHDTGNRNASLLSVPQSRERLREVPARRPDSAWRDVCASLPADAYRRLDLIKYDVEGAERAALLGSRELLLRDRPRLLVSLYHHSADLWELPLLVRSLCPSARLYLRRMAGVPAWDIELYVV